MHSTDYQKGKVYAWEAAHIPRNDRILYAQAQSIVNYIWEQEGLQYPPIVEPLDKRTTRWAGKANRLTVYLPEVTCTAVIIHELSHSMTADLDHSCAHGPWFVGMYTKLLAKYAGFNLLVLLHTLTLSNVDCNINAYPVFLDD
jgi:hypothetical protein